MESFHPFVAQTRPHPGQIECARNIAFFIGESYLARDVHTPKDRKRQDALAQDRYALRSAPQWIGPQLEDLLLAERQITVELNSSCDNPLVDATTGDILYGCNFQAASVTSAMEKTRLSLQMLGRLLFSQLTELVDPTLSGGLPSCLAADNPSLSFTMKGVDINMAAYMAELSYLANPMSSHVQAAEMHNQSVNSMALASARMSMQAVDILTMMCACSLYAGCQALDLRTLHETFKRNAIDALVAATADSLGASMRPEDRDSLRSALEYRMAVSWDSTGKLDLYERCQLLVETAALPIVLDRVNDAPANRVLDWKRMAVDLVYRIWRETFDAFCAKQHTPDLLGRGSYVIYRFVRETLGVPFHQGFVEHPSAAAADTGGRVKKTVGGWISIIHNAIETGEIYSPLMALMVEDTSGSACNANSTARL